MKRLRRVLLPSLSATEQEACILASCLHPGDLLLFYGDLGVGKTAFARALIRALAQDEDLLVPSPTFNLIQIFDTKQGALWHADLYRLTSSEEVRALGLEEAFFTAICLIEWPERLDLEWQARGLHLHFSMDEITGVRTLVYSAEKEEWAARLMSLPVSP